jgi:hypothetical protein
MRVNRGVCKGSAWSGCENRVSVGDTGPPGASRRGPGAAAVRRITPQEPGLRFASKGRRKIPKSSRRETGFGGSEARAAAGSAGW